MIYEISNLSYSYIKDKKVISNLNLKIDEGELITVLGKNGVGKSTLLNLMLGLFKSYDGTILLNGKDLSKLREKEISKTVSFVPQSNNPTFDIKVFDYVLMGLASRIGIFDKPGKEEESETYNALDIMGITNLKDRSFLSLSGGERQQVAISRAIVSKPKIILFDEPTSHLDYANQIKVLRMIKDLSLKGYSVIITTHDPNHAIVLNGNVLLFKEDGVVKGSTEELITEESLRDIYGSDLKVKYMDEVKRNVCVYPLL